MVKSNLWLFTMTIIHRSSHMVYGLTVFEYQWFILYHDHVHGLSMMTSGDSVCFWFLNGNVYWTIDGYDAVCWIYGKLFSAFFWWTYLLFNGKIDEYHLIIFTGYEYLWFLNIYGICMRHGNIYGMYTRRSTPELGNINGFWEYIQYDIISTMVIDSVYCYVFYGNIIFLIGISITLWEALWNIYVFFCPGEVDC